MVLTFSTIILFRVIKMKKIFCVLAAAAMFTLCFAGCGNNGNNSAMQNASEAVSDVGSQIATAASDVMGDGAVSDTDGLIGNEENGTTDNNNQNATDNTKIDENNNNYTNATDELM